MGEGTSLNYWTGRVTRRDEVGDDEIIHFIRVVFRSLIPQEENMCTEIYWKLLRTLYADK